MRILKEILIGILGYIMFSITLIFCSYIGWLILRLLFDKTFHTATAGYDIDILRDLGWGFWERT